MGKKPPKLNPIDRTIGRGAGARGTKHEHSHGKDAHKKAKQSTRGHYKVEFTQSFEKVSEKDVELRKTYGIDLVAQHVGVPADMIHLRPKNTEAQTTTTVSEVYYVKVGKDNYGKLAIMTQRLFKKIHLTFVFQAKKTAQKPPKPSFQRKVSFRGMRTSEKQQSDRQSYRTRKKGKR